MRIFNFDPERYAASFQENGYVHIPHGTTPEFMASLLAYADRQLVDRKLDAFAIKGKKEQALYDFPADVDITELYDAVCTTCGLDRERITLSERHIQIYEPNAAPEPAAHKDRFPTQIAVGFSIRVPAGSQLVLYPYSHREPNPFNTSVGLRRHLQPDELPEVVLKGARELTIDDQDGDIVMFPGSSVWHLRRRAANTLNLYLKFNDFGCDPLGEDPFTERRRARTLEALGAGEAALPDLVATLGRRLDSISRTSTRGSAKEVLEARIFGEEPVGLTVLQHRIVTSLNRPETVRALAARVANGAGPADAARQIAVLARSGILDLEAPAPAPHHDTVLRNRAASGAGPVNLGLFPNAPR